MIFNFEHMSDRDKETIIINNIPVLLSEPSISIIEDEGLTVKIQKDKIRINIPTYEAGNLFLSKYFNEEQIKKVEMLKTSKHAHFDTITSEIITSLNEKGKLKKYIIKNIVDVRNDIYNMGQPNEYYPGIVISKTVSKYAIED